MTLPLFPTCAYCGWSPRGTPSSMYSFGPDGWLCEPCHDNHLLRSWPAGQCVLGHVGAAQPLGFGGRLRAELDKCRLCRDFDREAIRRLLGKLQRYGYADDQGVTVRGAAALQAIDAKTWDRKPPPGPSDGASEVTP